MNSRNDFLIPAIEEWNAHLDLYTRNEKYKKMAASPFTFFRSTNHLFWNDLANDERLRAFSANNRTWIAGDMHVYNFGIVHNEKGKLIYDFNDFDEAIIADYQYDLWRMATSMILACKSENEFSKKDRKEIIDVFSQSYIDTLYTIYSKKETLNRHCTIKNSTGILKQTFKQVKKHKNRSEFLNEWTNRIKGKRIFDLSLNQMGNITREKRNEIIAAFPAYRKTLENNYGYEDKIYEIKDIAYRLYSGLGSMGVPRYYVLVEGEKNSDKEDFILDVKWQSKPTAYHFLGKEAAAEYDEIFSNEGQRYKTAYLSLIQQTDPYLGWMQLSDGYYSVREISPYKSFVPIESLTKKKHYLQMCRQWAFIIASNHAFSCEKFDLKQFYDLTKGNKKAFRNLIYEIAVEYDHQIENDWKEFREFLKEEK